MDMVFVSLMMNISLKLPLISHINLLFRILSNQNTNHDHNFDMKCNANFVRWKFMQDGDQYFLNVTSNFSHKPYLPILSKPWY